MIRGRIPDSILANMSLEEKIGQMMIMGFHGTTPSSDIKMLIQKYHIGGTILFSRNITDPRQVARLTKRLQSIALASKLHLPLLVATDQE
jgi:beta-N-acetylhexosaminidase